MFDKQLSGMSKINDFIFIGGYEAGQNPEILRSQRITHVLNVGSHDYDADYLQEINFFFHIKYLYLPIEDDKNADLASVLEQALSFINSSRKYGNILIHCQYGLSRSVAIAMAWLIKNSGFSYDEALHLITKKRPLASLNSGLQMQLKSIEASIRAQALAKKNLSVPNQGFVTATTYVNLHELLT